MTQEQAEQIYGQITEDLLEEALDEMHGEGRSRIGDGRIWKLVKEHKDLIITLLPILVGLLGKEQDQK